MGEATKNKSPLEKLDEELSEFYKYLKKNNFNNEEILQIFQPMLEVKRRPTYKKIIIISMFFILYGLIKTQTGWFYFLAFSRIFLIQIKPFYDWSHLKNQECLVAKWWQREPSVNYTPNCNFCENIAKPDYISHGRLEELEELYLDVQKPVILEFEGFPTRGHLWSSFFQDENFLTSFPCSAETNVMEKGGTVGKLLRKMSLFPDFFVHFQNCEYEGMKYFRTMVSLPDVGPRHLSPVQYNWLLWSKNYTFSKFKTIDLVYSENVKMLCQLSGEAVYRLIPPDFCGETCAVIEVVLKKDQVMVFTNFWRLEYRVLGGEVENVAVIHEAHSVL